MRRMTLLGMACFALPGCAEETFPTPPDCSGRQMVVYARQPGAGAADIYLYDFASPGFHLLTGLNSDTEQDLDPAITNDDRFIAFERVLAGGDVDIVLYDRCAAATLPQPGLNTPFPEVDPAFSHDGLRLAFARDSVDGSRIRLYDGDGSRLVPLPGIDTAGVHDDHSPAVDQSGNLIAFVSNRNGNSDVLVYDANGDTLLALPDLSSSSEDVDPSITPNGRYLVFASDRPGGSGGFDLYLYDLQTTSFVALDAAVNTVETERHPSIEPSADRMVFESNRTGVQGASDLWLHARSAHTTERAGASSAAADLQPYLVWR